MPFEGPLFRRTCPHCGADNPRVRIKCVSCKGYMSGTDLRKYYGKYGKEKDVEEDTSDTPVC